MAPSETTSKRRGRLALAALAALAFPAVLACNSLIGLSDFEKGQCAGARCADDGSFPDVVYDGGGGDVVQEAAPDARGADPVSWAKWPMPNYGEGGAGDPIHAPMLVLTGDFVTDNVTKLVWRATLVNGDFGPEQADVECQKLPGGPWRAPKRIELVTLLDYARSTPFIDTTKFKDVKNYRVWSTSAVRPFVPGDPAQKYWVVNFETGAVEPLAGTLVAKVLCVRAK